jgi:hypothetical protein
MPPGRAPLGLGLVAIGAAAALAGCGSSATTVRPQTPPGSVTSRTSPTATVDPATQSFLNTTTTDRLAYVAQFGTVLAVCPFPTVNSTVIAPANLDPCDPALAALAAATRKYQADPAAFAVPPQYASAAASLSDGLALTLTSVAEFKPVDHSRNVNVVGASTSKMWDAHLEVENALSQ